MNKLIKTLLLLMLIVTPLCNIYSYKDTAVSKNEVDNINIQQQIKNSDEKFSYQIQSLKEINELNKRIQKNESEIDSLKSRIYDVIIIVGIIGSIVAFFGWRTTKKVITEFSERRIDIEVKNRITDEYVRKLIIEKGEPQIQKIINDTKEKMTKQHKEYEDMIESLKSQQFDPSIPLTDELKSKISAIEEKLTKVKTEEYYDYDDWYYKGIAEYGKKEYNRAIDSLNKAIEIRKTDFLPYSYLGICYYDLNDNDTAIENYTKSIELNPTNDATFYNRSLAYSKKGEHDKVIEDCNKAIELNPKNELAYGNRGGSYALKGEFSRALEDYNNSITLNPNYELAYAMRGATYAMNNEYDKAIDDYTKAIELSPNMVKTHYSRGFLYLNKGDNDNAIKDFIEELRINPNNVNTNQYLNEAYIITGRYSEAQKSILKSYTLKLELSDLLIFAYYNCIALKLLEKDTSEADIEFEKYLNEEFKLSWLSTNIENWLQKTTVSKEKKEYIRNLTEKMKAKIKA